MPPADYFFILASGSPRRREFMELLGLPFTVLTPQPPIDETPLPGESPTTLVQRLSRVKAQTVTAILSSRSGLKPDLCSIVIAADTVVVLEDNILGKPKDPAEAAQMLHDLRDRPHHVYSGLTVAADKQVITQLHQSTVWMRPYTDAEIAAYIATGDPLDKAGAYGIQHKGFAPVARLEGCFASVMGFPLGELAVALRQLGVSLPEIEPLCTSHTGQRCCQQTFSVPFRLDS